jgi:excisionase family DNA binding protein
MSFESLEQLEFLTVSEVAVYLRVARMTVYRMIDRGDLSAVRVGKSFRIPAQALRDYLAAHSS